MEPFLSLFFVKDVMAGEIVQWKSKRTAVVVELVNINLPLDLVHASAASVLDAAREVSSTVKLAELRRLDGFALERSSHGRRRLLLRLGFTRWRAQCDALLRRRPLLFRAGISHFFWEKGWVFLRRIFLEVMRMKLQAIDKCSCGTLLVECWACSLGWTDN